MSLYKEFKNNISKSLQKDLWKKNILAVPRVDKVVVSMGIWTLVTRKAVKDFSDLIDNLQKITWQKPVVVNARKSVASFKLREWMPVMLKVTLRREKAYDFLEKLNKLVLPRVRDFAWLSDKKFDGKWNYNIWFKDQSVFPELSPEEIITPHGIQVNIWTNTTDDEEARKLLESLWIIFAKKN